MGGRLASKARFSRIFSIFSTSAKPAGSLSPTGPSYRRSFSRSTSGSAPRLFFSLRWRCFSDISAGRTVSGS